MNTSGQFAGAIGRRKTMKGKGKPKMPFGHKPGMAKAEMMMPGKMPKGKKKGK